MKFKITQMNLKRIDGYEDYFVSENGRVFSTKFGKFKEIKSELTGSKDYKKLRVGLRKNGIKKKFLVHRLVATAFYGPCPNGMECCHNDGNPMNNHRDNLRWDTRKNNQADRKIHETCCSITKKVSGSNHGLSKLTEADVMQIRATYAAGGIFQKNLADQYGVTPPVISHIINRKTWTHI
jgi:hypothetical protein